MYIIKYVVFDYLPTEAVKGLQTSAGLQTSDFRLQTSDFKHWFRASLIANTTSAKLANI